MNTVTVTFNKTTLRQMTEMSQWEKRDQQLSDSTLEVC